MNEHYYIESYIPNGTQAEEHWTVQDGESAIARVKAILAEGKIARILCPSDAPPDVLRLLAKLGAQRF